MSGLVISGAIALIKANVAALQNQVSEAADLAELVSTGNLPRRLPAAFVVWSGERATPNDMASISRQEVTEAFSVVLVNRIAGDAAGAKASTQAQDIGDDLILAMLGWQASPTHDPCEYAGGRLLGLQAGAVITEFNFITRWQLRKQ